MKTSFFLALGANLAFFASFQWIYVTLPAHIQSLGGDAAAMGLAYGLITLSAVAVRPALGRLSDRWCRKPLLLAGAALFVLSPVLYALCTSLAPFMAVRLLHGVGLASFTTAYTALVADLAPAARRGEAIGLSGVTNNLGLLFAPALGAYVQARWGFVPHFWAAACIAALALVALAPLRDTVSAAAPAPLPGGMRSIGRQRAVWTAALGGTGLAVAYGVVLSFLAPFAAQRGLGAAGGYFSAFAVAMMVAQASSGWLSDRIGRRAVALPGLAAVVLAIGCLALVRSDAALLAAGAGLGLSWGLTRAGLDTSVIDGVPDRARGTALALVYTCFDVGVGVGSLGFGLVARSQGYAASFGLAAVWALLALAAYGLWGNRHQALPS